MRIAAISSCRLTVLPEMSRKRKPDGTKPSGGVFAIVLIVAGVLIALFALALAGAVGDGQGIGFCLLPAIGAGIAGLVMRDSYNKKLEEWEKAQAWNREAEQEESDWNEVVNRWYQGVSQANQSTRTDDVLGRFIRAISTTIKQVTKTLFEDQQAEIRDRIEKEHT